MSPQDLLAGGHGVDDELDAFRGGYADFKHPSGFVSSDQHHQIFHLEHSHRISVCVKHVVIRGPVFAGTRHNHRIHTHQVSLIPRYVTRKRTASTFLERITSPSEAQQIGIPLGGAVKRVNQGKRFALAGLWRRCGASVVSFRRAHLCRPSVYTWRPWGSGYRT